MCRFEMVSIVLALAVAPAGANEPPPPSLYALTVNTLAGKPQPLATYKGKVALVVTKTAGW
jgi:hypothetical protein